MNTPHYQYLYRYLRINQYFDDVSIPYGVTDKSKMREVLSPSNPIYEYLRGYIDGMWMKYEDLVLKLRPWLSENPHYKV
jgi:hypothetical protein